MKQKLAYCHIMKQTTPLSFPLLFFYLYDKPEQTGDGHQWIEQFGHQVNLIAVVFGLWIFGSADGDDTKGAITYI